MAIVAAALIPAAAGACMFDVDCAVGSQCVKKSGSLYGVCLGGLWPGNGNDRQPGRSPTAPRTGQTCQFDYQCGPGLSCVKGSGRIYGACY